MTLGFFAIPQAPSDGTDSRWYNAAGGHSVFLHSDPYGPTRAVLTLKQDTRAPSYL